MKASVTTRHPLDFIARVLVDCPRCGGKGVIESPPQPAQGRRMTCSHCAAVVEGSDNVDHVTLDLPLRLRVETRHGELHAFNEDHLTYIETYLKGLLREERSDGTGLRNQSIVSRLPRWAKLGRNRQEVLKAIAQVRLNL